MVRTNELRIGNWVNNLNNQPIQILGTGLTYFYYQPIINGIAQHFECVTGDQIKSIQLYDSLLLKCGFIKKGDWFYKEQFINL